MAHLCLERPWIIACFHEAEGQWLLAVSKDGDHYHLMVCPGYGFGRGKQFNTEQEAMDEFHKRQEEYLEDPKRICAPLKGAS